MSNDKVFPYSVAIYKFYIELYNLTADCEYESLETGVLRSRKHRITFKTKIKTLFFRLEILFKHGWVRASYAAD